MGGLIEQDQGHQIVLVVAVELERWTPEPAEDGWPKELPPHRLLYDARTDELRVEWLSVSTGDWSPCENENLHLPLFESAFAKLRCTSQVISDV